MASGVQVFGPSGEIWLDTNDITTRVVGLLYYTSTFTANAITYPCPPGARPFGIGTASNGLNVGINTYNNGNGTATITFDMGVGYNSGFPPNGQITIYFGWC